MPAQRLAITLRCGRVLLAGAVTATLIVVETAAPQAAAPAERWSGESPALVKQLTEVMKQQGLTALAAKDPREPGRYTAAMFFPGVQLLVITAKSGAPEYMDFEIAAKNYAAVYTALQHGVPESRLFVQDLGCDGLNGAADGAPDVVYERGVKQHILDGDHKRAQMSREAYATLFESLDRRYARLLALLLESARSPGAPAGSPK